MTSNAMQASAITISVVIPAYNAANHIARAIDSVLAQTHPVDQIIVIDDGSTDATPDIAQSYGDKVIYIHQQNASAGATRNAGIRAAKSEWIAFLDSDDEWLPKKIQLQTELIQRNPELMWAHTNCFVQPGNDNSQYVRLNEKKAATILDSKEYFDSYLDSVTKSFPAWTGTIIAKRQAIIDVGLFNPQLALAQDIDLWFRIAYKYPKIGFIATPLAVYYSDTPQSNTKRFRNISYICAIADNHIELSALNNCATEFQQCLYPLINYWILSLEKEFRHDDIKLLLNKYRKYLPVRYYIRKSIRALLPGPVGCYNKIIAKL